MNSQALQRLDRLIGQLQLNADSSSMSAGAPSCSAASSSSSACQASSGCSGLVEEKCSADAQQKQQQQQQQQQQAKHPDVDADALIQVTRHANGCARIHLTREKALNALNLAMVRRILELLRAWREDPQVKLVVISGAGERAFCAGGDIAALARPPYPGWPADFFRAEYTMNFELSRFPKPIVSLMDGIVMGGGAGLSVHGSFRVLTERTLFAMPECGIGFVPDVGSTFFLSQAPGQIGYYLALTGHRAKAADCMVANIGTHYVPSERLGQVARLLETTQELGGTPQAAFASVQRLLDSESVSPPALAETPLVVYRKNIDETFAGRSVAEIRNRLLQLIDAGDPGQLDWAKEALAAMDRASPRSLFLTLTALNRADQLSLAECLRMEFRVAVRQTAGAEFKEGVRAQVIDKDRKPKWDLNFKPSKQEEEFYFRKLGDGEVEELQLN